MKDLLDETRLAMLGAQILIGLQYRAAFSPQFKNLPSAFQVLDCVALLLILATVGILLATPAFHQISERGHATGRMITRASSALQIALGPLALALGLDIAIGLVATAGAFVAVTAGTIFVLSCVTIWHVVPTYAAQSGRYQDNEMEDKQQSLEARIVQILTELRVILPGAQALFGFQVSAVLTDGFQQLSPVTKTVHLMSLGLVAIAIIMLIAPASYHRIAARGNAEEAVLRYTVRMMLPAEGLIGLGLIGGAFVTLNMVAKSQILAISLSAAVLVAFAILLYGLPLMARWERRA